MNIDTLITNADAYWFGYIVFHALKEVMAAKNKHMEEGTAIYMNPEKTPYDRYIAAHKVAITHDIRYYISILTFPNDLQNRKTQVYKKLGEIINLYPPVEDGSEKDKPPYAAYQNLNTGMPEYTETVDNVIYIYGQNNYYVIYLNSGSPELKVTTLLKVITSSDETSTSLVDFSPEKDMQVKKIFILKKVQTDDYPIKETYIDASGDERQRAKYREDILMQLFTTKIELPTKTIISLLE
jgi:hypothetical protein